MMIVKLDVGWHEQQLSPLHNLIRAKLNEISQSSNAPENHLRNNRIILQSLDKSSFLC